MCNDYSLHQWCNCIVHIPRVGCGFQYHFICPLQILLRPSFEAFHLYIPWSQHNLLLRIHSTYRDVMLVHIQPNVSTLLQTCISFSFHATLLVLILRRGFLGHKLHLPIRVLPSRAGSPRFEIRRAAKSCPELVEGNTTGLLTTYLSIPRPQPADPDAPAPDTSPAFHLSKDTACHASMQLHSNNTACTRRWAAGVLLAACRRGGQAMPMEW